MNNLTTIKEINSPLLQERYCNLQAPRLQLVGKNFAKAFCYKKPKFRLCNQQIHGSYLPEKNSDYITVIMVTGQISHELLSTP